MASDPSLDPSPHNGKAPARVSYPEVVDPAPQLRVDLGDQRLHRLGPVASEHLLELLQQRLALLLLPRILKPPTPPESPKTTAVKAQNSEALLPAQAHHPALVLCQPDTTSPLPF